MSQGTSISWTDATWNVLTGCSKISPGCKNCYAIDVAHVRAGNPHPELDGLRELDWVIVGGESGHGARVCDVEWIRSIVRECKQAGVPCFVKQLGAKPLNCADEGTCSYLPLKDRKGSDPSEWPEDLRVQQFPQEAK